MTQSPTAIPVSHSAPAEVAESAGEYCRLLSAMLNDLGRPLQPRAALLDFGCGIGNQVYELRRAGYEAYGVDVEDRSGAVLERCQAEGLCDDLPLFGTVDLAAYRIPFPDGTFDAVFSNQVLEHVANWEESLSEIRRVLKPKGCSLHIFPSKYRPLESHVHTPFAGSIRAMPYLMFCALVGFRIAERQGLSLRETARRNKEFLDRKTHYLPKRQMLAYARAHFATVQFAEATFIRCTDSGAGRLRPLLRALPLTASLFSTFQSRVLFLAK